MSRLYGPLRGQCFYLECLFNRHDGSHPLPQSFLAVASDDVKSLPCGRCRARIENFMGLGFDCFRYLGLRARGPLPGYLLDGVEDAKRVATRRVLRLGFRIQGLGWDEIRVRYSTCLQSTWARLF